MISPSRIRRVVLQNDAVFLAARLVLAAVGDDVAGRLRLVRREAPLLAGVGKPAPPRPRSPDAVTVSIIASGVLASACFSAS